MNKFILVIVAALLSFSSFSQNGNNNLKSQIGEEVSELTFLTADAEDEVNLSNQKGKVVVIYVPRCVSSPSNSMPWYLPPSKIDIPAEYILPVVKDNSNVVLWSVFYKRDDLFAERVLDPIELKFPFYIDYNGKEIEKLFKRFTGHALIVIDQNGRLQFAEMGEFDLEEKFIQATSVVKGLLENSK